MLPQVILLYSRPWLKNELTAKAKAIACKQIIYMSEHSSCDETGLSAITHFDGRSRFNPYFQSRIGSQTINEIIARCRLLRSLPYAEALNYIYATEELVQSIFTSYKVDLVYMLPVDSFILDIIARLAYASQVKIHSEIGSPFRFYSRSTVFGEYIHCHTPSGREIEKAILSTRNLSYFPPYMSKHARITATKLDTFISFYGNKLVNVFKMLTLYSIGVVTGQRYGYHFRSSLLLRKLALSYKSMDLKMNSYENIYSEKEFIFVPLHVYPEATVDYWSSVSMALDYHSEVLKYLLFLSRFFHVVVKDHPANKSGRPTSFLCRLSQIPNVTIMNSSTPSKLIISSNMCIGVFTNSGVSGIEAIALGKYVFYPYDAKPYYFFDNHLFHEVNTTCESFDFQHQSHSMDLDNYAFVFFQKILSGLRPSNKEWLEYLSPNAWYHQLTALFS